MVQSGLSNGLDEDPILPEIVARLVRALRPERIYLFGSRARGEAEVESDHDILVIAETDLDSHARRVAARGAVGFVGAACDIFVYTPEEFEKFRGWVSGIARLAVDEGVVVYDATAG